MENKLEPSLESENQTQNLPTEKDPHRKVFFTPDKGININNIIVKKIIRKASNDPNDQPVKINFTTEISPIKHTLSPIEEETRRNNEYSPDKLYLSPENVKTPCNMRTKYT
jgi:hypothetical protein